VSDYATVRDIFREFIGQTVVDITQHDQDEWEETGEGYILLMFGNGATIKITVAEGNIETEDYDS
jgi:hypothetical protein